MTRLDLSGHLHRITEKDAAFVFPEAGNDHSYSNPNNSCPSGGLNDAGHDSMNFRVIVSSHNCPAKYCIGQKFHLVFFYKMALLSA